MQGAIGGACDDFPAPKVPFVARAWNGAHQAGSVQAGPVGSPQTTTSPAVQPAQ
jgi:hypothetical protein